MFLDGGRPPRVPYLESSDQEKMALAASNAARALDAGITTVRDCDSPASLMFEFIPLPRRPCQEDPRPGRGCEPHGVRSPS
jgi:hypothetical protein